MSKYGSPEKYSRLLRSDWLKENNTRIHYNAFEPRKNKDDNRLEVSCFETQGISSNEVKDLALKNEITLNGKLPVGFCSIEENDFPFDLINIDKNYNPERHIDLVGWTDNKLNQKEVATLLAEKASNMIEIF